MCKDSEAGRMWSRNEKQVSCGWNEEAQGKTGRRQAGGGPGGALWVHLGPGFGLKCSGGGVSRRDVHRNAVYPRLLWLLCEEQLKRSEDVPWLDQRCQVISKSD